MPAGPILIFDKSALQALSLDESNWLDNFFMTNITPLFFAETLADLEKEVGKGRTPEEVVGHLALKTPDMQATACAHHEKILGGDLYGHHIPLDGRIPRDFGRVVDSVFLLVLLDWLERRMSNLHGISMGGCSESRRPRHSFQ